jgi:hypothetical protein
MALTLLMMLLGMAAGAYPAVLSQGGDAGVVIHYTADKTSVSAGEPVVVVLTIDNTSADKLTTDLGFDMKEHIAIEIKSPNGQMCRRHISNTDSGSQLGAIGRISIAPGERYLQRILLSEVCPFAEVGNYVANFDIHAAIINSRGDEVQSPKDASITISVLQRDEKMLTTRCDEYLCAIKALTKAKDIMDAAREMSYINDPACASDVKYAIKLNKIGAQLILIHGLSRNATDWSTEALADVFDSIDSTYKNHARALLKEAEPRVTNEQIREKVKKILSQ